MMAFDLWRKVKQKLRRGRRPMWQLASCLLVAGTVMALSGAYASPALAAGSAPSEKQVTSSPSTGEVRRSVIAALSDMQGKLTVKLHRIYMCGEETETLGEMSGAEALSMMKKHPEWTAVLDKQGAVFLEQRINDLSDACKQSAYFGLDKLGRLSLFEGMPKEEKVLRTFFQLDVNYMESSLPRERLDELVKGIRVSDKDVFNSVLSSYSDYAMERTAKVMKRTY